VTGQVHCCLSVTTPVTGQVHCCLSVTVPVTGQVHCCLSVTTPVTGQVHFSDVVNDCVDESDGFNLSHTGEHQFQFLDVTSSVSPDDTPAQSVTGATHYYASLPQPQQVYLIIDQSGGIYPALTSASVAAATVLTSSRYVAPVQPMMPAQVQSAGVMLPPGVIPAPAQTRNLIGPTLMRPGLIQQPPAPSVMMPSGLVPVPPTGMLPPPPPTSIIAAHATMLPLPQSVSQMPVPTVSEMPVNANTTLGAGYLGQPLLAGANGLDNQPLQSVPVDMHVSAKSPQHKGMYITSGANVNNSAADELHQSHSDVVLPVTEPTYVDSVDADISDHGNGLLTYKECADSDAGVQCGEAAVDVESCTAAASVNGELTVDASHELGSSSESSSVTSPSSAVADMMTSLSSTLSDITVTDNAIDRDVMVTKDTSHSPVTSVSAVPAASVASSSKTKAPSWASLLKDTTSATNAIVISMNDSHAAAAQQKTDIKSVVKEPATRRSPVSCVSTDEKLKLEVSGLYILLQMSSFCKGKGKVDLYTHLVVKPLRHLGMDHTLLPAVTLMPAFTS